MRSQRSRPRARSRGGSTLVELLITTVLTVTFIYVVSIFSISFERAGAEVIARAGLAREADIAFARVADDLRAAADSKRRKMTVTNPNANEIWLIFKNDCAITPSDCSDSITVKYTVQNRRLIRELTPSAAPAETVAWSVEGIGLSTTSIASGGSLYEIHLTLGTSMVENRAQAQTLSRVYTLVTVLP
jgi:hypothetical protein